MGANILRVIIVALACILLTGCPGTMKPNVGPTEVVEVPVPVQQKVNIPSRPVLDILTLPSRPLPNVREKAVVSTMAQLVAHVKSLECLLVPYATNAAEYADWCKSQSVAIPSTQTESK